MFAKRRERVLDAMGPDAVAILIGAHVATRSNDTEYPFRQDSDFWYLTGFDHPDAVAVLRTDGGPTYTLFVQPREKAAETWTGYRPGVEGAKEWYGADAAHPIDEIETELRKLVHGAGRLFHQLGREEPIDRLVISTLDEMRQRSRLGMTPAREICDPREILHELRLFKSEAEIELMRRAAEISREAHAAVASIARGGTNEYELEALLDYTFRRRGGSGAAYGSIVAGGANATVLHYVTNDCELRDGDMVLIDAGCEYASYASDVTRTYPVGGRFGAAHRAVYEVVLAAQQASLELCEPGRTLDEIHEASLRTLVEGMVSLELLSGTVDDLVESKAYEPYYMHRTSHWLGLDVHDVGHYTIGKEPRKLEPGIAFTVEPGLYIGADAEEAPEHLRGIGVRIEDDVVVTESGHENLTAAIPKKIGEVEALFGG